MKTQIFNNLNDPKRRHLLQFVLGIAAIVMALGFSLVFADEENASISGAFQSLSSSFYGEILATAKYVVPVYLAIVFLILVAGGKDAWDKARKGIFIAAGALAGVYLAPVIVAWIIDQVSTLGGNTAFSELANKG